MRSPHARPPFYRFATPEEKIAREIQMFLETIMGIFTAIIILVLALAAAPSVPVAYGPYIVTILVAIIYRKDIDHTFTRGRVSGEAREDE